MLTVLPRVTMNPRTRTVRFEGEPFGAAVSFFLVDAEPGQGPDLHQHPYAEVFTIVSGRALITAGDEQIEAGREHIAIVGPDTPHGFAASVPTGSRWCASMPTQRWSPRGCGRRGDLSLLRARVMTV